MADVEASRSGVWTKLFQDVLFVESGGTVFVSGIESRDGFPEEYDPIVSARQQFFIDFLRAETRNDAEADDALLRMPGVRHYRCELLATAAYVKARGHAFNMGIGYLDESGEYQLIAVQAAPPGGGSQAQ